MLMPGTENRAFQRQTRRSSATRRILRWPQDEVRVSERREPDISLSEAIRRAREDLGITQDELARRLGVSTRTVARWESGASEPKGAAQKERLAEAVSPSSVAGAAVSAALGFLGQPAGIAAAALGAATAGYLFTRGRPDPERLKVVSMLLRGAADELDVTWERFREALGPAMRQASSMQITIDELVSLLS